MATHLKFFSPSNDCLIVVKNYVPGILDLTNQLIINYQFFDNYAREGTLIMSSM